MNPAIERKLITLGNKRFTRTLILTVTWLALVVAAFAVCVIALKRSLADPQSYLILLLGVPPFFPFGVHKVLLSKTFRATVVYNVHSTQFEGLEWAETHNRPTKVDILEIICRRDDGKEIAVTFKKDRFPNKGLHYAEGDRLLFVRGLKYPYRLSATDGAVFTCPLCGTTVEAHLLVCRKCRLDLNQ